MASTRIHVQLGLVESIWLILGYMYTRTSREYMDILVLAIYSTSPSCTCILVLVI